MAEAVPLRATLSVQVVQIIINDSFEYSLDFVLEGFTAKCRHIRDIER